MAKEERKIVNIVAFISGDPEKQAPEKITFSYDVQSGSAVKKNSIYMMDEFKTEAIFEDIWLKAITQIKKIEGVK